MATARFTLLLLAVMFFQCSKSQNNPPSGCTDQDWCKTFSTYCTNQHFQQQMLTACPNTCGTCPYGSSTDERCVENNGGCQHRCSIGEESDEVECSCFAGYQLQLDKTSCEDVNECSRSPQPCDTLDRPFCVNQQGSFFCTSENCAATQGHLNRYQSTECCRSPDSYPCGRERYRPDDRIVGGTDSVAGRWPWMVHILVDRTTLCGGTLIDPNWVLTAGHCFLRANVSNTQVKLTFGAIEPGKRETHVQKRDGVEIVFYPHWKRDRFPYNDIALVRLDHPVEYGEFAHPACLPNGERPRPGTTCWAVGYGTVEYRGKAAETLQEVDLPIVSLDKCKPVYAGSSYPVDGNVMFCAGHEQGGKDACQGDSGGPLLCQRCSSCQWYVAGITSFGKGCARPGVYGVYTDVEKFEEWVGAQTNIPVNKDKVCGQAATSRWSSWSEWSTCSASCGGGSQTQDRTCVRGRPGSDDCVGTSTRSRSCANATCPVWGPYGEWTTCSVPCGGGQRNRTRQCIGGNVGDSGCDGSDVLVESCNQHPCPTWMPWAEWSSCPVTCGGGKQNSMRTCDTHGVPDVTCDGDRARMRDCNTHDCPVWGAYGPWTTCSATCGGGKRNHTRQCEGGNVGDVGCEGSDVEVEDCNQHACPTWRPWAPWTRCSVTCGGGEQRSVRACYSGGAEVEAATCGGKSVRTRTCNTQLCPTWDPWEEWSDCTKSCQGGTTTRRRKCTNGSPGQVGCHVGSDKQTNDCNTEECGAWSSWTSWSTCSETCGGGRRAAERVCRGGAAGTGGCPGSATRRENCETQACPYWDNWSRFSDCSASCGGGTKRQTRKCINGAPGDDACLGAEETTIKCNTQPCPVWNDWTTWTQCTETCGSGKRRATRTCLYGLQGDVGCQGEEEKMEDCNTQSCPRWDEYGAWGSCSRSCGGGEKRRTRECLNGSPGQMGCHVGTGEEVMNCGEGLCPVWSEWDPWSECSQSCSGGVRTRSRNCMHSSSVSDCQGRATRSENCNTETCPPKYEDWSEWSECTVTCGGGTQSRSRKCVEYCSQDRVENRPCNDQQCPVLGDWTEWSQCSVSCGPGSRSRSRQCTGTANPDDCQANLAETEDCYPSCMSDWSAFGPCSVTCGVDGKEMRSRQCISSRNDNSECAGPFTEEQSCGEPCPSSWTTWGQWSTCSHTCNGGYRRRLRNCIGGPVGVGGCAPADRAQQDQLCNNQDCPQDCVDLNPLCASWVFTFFTLCTDLNDYTRQNCKATCNLCGEPGPWSAWGECTARCEGGVQTRTRVCQNSRGCSGPYNNARVCNPQPCEGYTQWSPWSPCSESCAGGSRDRTRYCPPGTNCPPDEHGSETEQTETCNAQACPGEWGSWSDWTRCSATCGPGSQTRERSCQGGEQGGPGCTEHASESQSCELSACPGSWGPWRDVGTCTALCGPGQQPQRRSCIGGVAGGPGCLGGNTRTSDCNLEPCVTRWLEWGNWGQCNKQCGGGEARRERECEHGSPGDQGCEGDDFETKACNAQACDTGPCAGTSDIIQGCLSLEGSCDIQFVFMEQNCKKTCCEYRNRAPVAPPLMRCEDNQVYQSLCQSWKNFCNAPQLAWMRTYCKRTCGLC